MTDSKEEAKRQWIEKQLADAPPLTETQRRDIGRILASASRIDLAPESWEGAYRIADGHDRDCSLPDGHEPPCRDARDDHLGGGG